ncbi:MAG: cyclic peptide export ABC transporter [Blastocatellia bacterium]
MKLFMFLIRRSPGSITLAVVTGVICGASNILLLAFFTTALKENGYNNSKTILAFFGLCLLLPIARFISESVLVRLSHSFLYDLRMQFSRQILAAPLSDLEELGVPPLLSVLTDHIPTITGAVVLLPGLFINGAVILSGLIYLGWLSGSLLSVTMGFMLVGVIIYQLPTVKGIRHLRLARDDSNLMLKHFRNLTGGIKELKLHSQRRKSFLTEVLESTASSFRKRSVDGMTLFIAAGSSGQFLAFLLIGSILFLLPKLQEINSQTLIGYTITLLYLMNPLQLIMDTLPSLARASVALNNVENMGLTVASEPGATAAAVAPDPGYRLEQLELIGIKHTYGGAGKNEGFTLGPIDLALLPGEMVFISGGNGSGKTTLAKLITGLYTAESGEIRLNRHTVTDKMIEFYRQHFSVVFYDFHLFDSLLGLQRPELDDQVRVYLARLKLDHKLEIKDGVFSTTDLSQGQRKRLALLTAYIEDRAVYVFDEWAADQDPIFKDFFYYKLLPELRARGKTVLVITHDDRYYDVADRIIKLECGRIEYDRRITHPVSEDASVMSRS